MFVGPQECLQAERKYLHTVFGIPRTVGLNNMNYRPHVQCFPKKRAVYEIMWKNMLEADRP
jgi:hypothetical protein